MRRAILVVSVLAGLGLIALVYTSLSPKPPPPADAEIAVVMHQAEAHDVEGLRQSADSSDPKVAASAIQAYARVAGPASADDVQRFMSDPRPAIRAQAAAGWAFAGSKSNLKPLTTLIANDKNPQVRIAGLQSLGTLSAWDGLGAVLDRMADDSDAGVRRAAMRTFEQVAYLRINKTYDPDRPPAERRAAIAPLRGFVQRPAAREMYANWTNRNQQAAQ